MPDGAAARVTPAVDVFKFVELPNRANDPTRRYARVSVAGERVAELEVIRQICAEVKGKEERVKLWQQRTGKSQATFYRRLKEIGTGRNGSE